MRPSSLRLLANPNKHGLGVKQFSHPQFTRCYTWEIFKKRLVRLLKHYSLTDRKARNKVLKNAIKVLQIHELYMNTHVPTQSLIAARADLEREIATRQTLQLQVFNIS